MFFFLQQVEFFIEIKDFHKKQHYEDPLKENKTFFVRTIRGFVGSEFMKICHEQVKRFSCK